MKHIMLDLETMGTRPNAAVVAIGACTFDPYGAGLDESPGHDNKFYAKVDLESSVAAGLTIDPATILWWMQQSDAARAQTFGTGGQVPLLNALWLFHDFGRRLDDDVAVWGNGATLDNVVIRSAFAAYGITVPWSFRNDKCYRTVANLLPEAKRPALVPYGTAHNALDDAITQALHLQKVYKALGL